MWPANVTSIQMAKVGTANVTAAHVTAKVGTANVTAHVTATKTTTMAGIRLIHYGALSR